MAGGKERAFSDQDVLGRCKQCGQPYTSATRVSGPTGYFCSAECKAKHEHFMQVAQEIDRSRKPGMLSPGLLIRSILTKGFVLLLIVVFLVVVGSMFNIPVLTPIALKIRALVGI